MQFRMILAIIFFVLLVAFGIFEEFYVDKIFTDFSEMLEEIANTPDNKYDLQKMKDTYNWWLKKHQMMELFLPHIPLNEITCIFGEMIGDVQVEDYISATGQLRRMQSCIESLAEMSNIRLGNIL